MEVDVCKAHIVTNKQIATVNDHATHEAPDGVRETGSGDTTVTYQHNSYQDGKAGTTQP